MMPSDFDDDRIIPEEDIPDDEFSEDESDTDSVSEDISEDENYNNNPGIRNFLNNKIVDALVSAYLIYMSVSMFLKSGTIPAQHRVLYICFAVLFALAGAFFLVLAGKELLKSMKKK